MENLNIELRAEVTNAEQLQQALSCGIFRFVYAPEALLGENTPKKENIIIIPPVFLAASEKYTQNRLILLKNYGFSRAQAHTAGHIPLISEAGMTIHGGMRLNVTNSKAAGFYASQGFEDLTLSAELTAKRIKELKSPIPTGIVAYGRLPLMITRRCPISDGKTCGKEKNCGKYIEDRKGKRLSVSCQKGWDTVELLNPDLLTLADRLGDFPETSFFVMRFTDERDIVKTAEMFLEGKKPQVGITSGLYYRGVE